MTLIISLGCKDGVILASDGQATTFSTGGPIRRTISKIKHLGEHKLWAASGTVGMIQKIETVLSNLPKEILNTPLTEPQLRQAILQNAHALRVQELQRHRSLHGQGRDMEAGVADLLIVEYQGNPRIWHINPDCIDEFLEEFGYGTSGSGDVFAHTLLKNFKVKDLSIDQGCLIAYRVLRDAINIGAFGLGEPIDIWVIDNNGVKQKSQSEMLALRDSYAIWMEAEEETFRNLFLKKIKKDGD
jgi:20S proteasome alpha/beta subunit